MIRPDAYGPGTVEWWEDCCAGFVFYQPLCHVCGWRGPTGKVHRLDSENGPRVRQRAAQRLERHWWSKHKRAASTGGWRITA